MAVNGQEYPGALRNPLIWVLYPYLSLLHGHLCHQLSKLLQGHYNLDQPTDTDLICSLGFCLV